MWLQPISHLNARRYPKVLILDYFFDYIKSLLPLAGHRDMNVTSAYVANERIFFMSRVYLLTVLLSFLIKSFVDGYNKPLAPVMGYASDFGVLFGNLGGVYDKHHHIGTLYGGHGTDNTEALQAFLYPAFSS